MEYPEHEKMKAVQPQTQAIADFLSWLSDEKLIDLVKWHEDVAEYLPATESFERLLEEYFDIDPIKVEAERTQMLEELRG